MNVQDIHGRELHDRIIELVATAVDFGLSSAETTELEAHLAACPTCARRATALRNDASSLRLSLTLLPSRRVDDAVHAAIVRRSAGPRRLLALAAAALLLVALLGMVTAGAYLLRNSKTLPTTVVPIPTHPVVVASPGPDASPAALGDTWESVDFPPSSDGSVIEGITFAGADMVGVGRGGCVPDFDNPTSCFGAAWTATAGGRWVRAPDQPGLEMGVGRSISGPDSGIFDVASGPAGLVAIGYDYDPPRSSCLIAPCTTGPGVWRSPDGRTWERVLVDLGPSTIDRFSLPIAAITASSTGYVMVGYTIDYAAPEPKNGSASATAWASPDGVTWTRAIDSPDMDVGPCLDTGEQPSCGGMLGVVATGSGFAAVGQARIGAAADQIRPAAWTSPDGLTWTRSDSGLDFDGYLSGVTTGGPGLVAVGTLSTGAVAATSTDGHVWQFEPVTGAAPLRTVVSTGKAVFTLGVLQQDNPQRAELQLWRSDDGVAWQRVPGLPSLPDAVLYEATDIAAETGRLVIVGSAQTDSGAGSGNFAYVSPPFAPATVTLPPWTALEFQGGAPRGSLQSVASAGSGFVAAAGETCVDGSDPRRCQASIWTAGAGEAWTRVPDQAGLDVSGDEGSTGPAAGAFDVAAGPAGMVAVGSAPAGGTWNKAAIWSSPDGRTWQRVDLAQSPLDAHFEAVTANERGFVIVGWVDDYRSSPTDIHGRAAAWTSTDGIAWTRAADTAGMDIGPCWDAQEGAFCGGMRAVAAMAGGFVAVGHARTADSASGRLRPAAWTSPDGLTWTRRDAGLDFGGADGFLSDVTAGGFGVVAVGTACQPTCKLAPPDGNAGAGVAAESIDGSAWSITPIPTAVGSRAVISVVIKDETRKVFALGWGRDRANTSEFPPDVLELWFSPASGDWERTELPPIGGGFAVFGVVDIATGSDTLMLVGGIQQYVEGAPPDIDARGPGSFAYSSH